MKVFFILILLVGLVGGAFFLQKNFLKEEKVSIAIITDIDHCPGREAVNEANLEKFLDFSKDRLVDAQVSLGDNASHRLRDCSDTADDDMQYIAEKIRSTGIPSYFVLGDHDIASSVESVKRWQETQGTEKTFYSFDIKNVHVVVLDTVLGGDPMSPPCVEVESCKKATDTFGALMDQKGSAEYKRAKDELVQEEEKIKMTRSEGKRDAGRVGEEQLQWLKNDLSQTSKKKVLILSDHPLFPFTSTRKSYNTVNAENVREIVRKSGKETVYISGEAHLWHEEVYEGFQFYIIDEFRKANGSWALFEWDNEGFRLERVTN